MKGWGTNEQVLHAAAHPYADLASALKLSSSQREASVLTPSLYTTPPKPKPSSRQVLVRLLSGLDGEEMAEVVQVGPAPNDLALTRTL